ncbi:MAG: 50S ribosomal protein L19e [Candidatus Brockarchaeota archaeon]|nr:50S ribosomal protein L19e [Candidatus Brockarchaeota archaeon]
MGVKTVKRLAADILKVGESRIWIDPQRLEEVENAVTRADVRRLIKSGIIKKRPASTPSRGRFRARSSRRGPGSKKGAKGARISVTWVEKVRAQRRLLKELRSSKVISSKVYRRLYLMVKGGAFASKRALMNYVLSLKERGEAV